MFIKGIKKEEVRIEVNPVDVIYELINALWLKANVEDHSTIINGFWVYSTKTQRQATPDEIEIMNGLNKLMRLLDK